MCACVRVCLYVSVCYHKERVCVFVTIKQRINNPEKITEKKENAISNT